MYTHTYTHVETYIYIYIYTNSQLLRIQKVFNKLVLATNYKYLTKAKTSN